MMLVASLFISGSYDKIAGYAPGSQVTDHNAVDLDQSVMESYLSAGDFPKAKKIYEEGGNSKSYAELTVPATTKVIKKGAEMTATAKSGATITGKAYSDVSTDSTKIKFQYATSNTQWNDDGTPGYNDCRVGGMESPAASGETCPGDECKVSKYYKDSGCVDETKAVTVTYEDGSTEAITASGIAHKNGRKIQGFSTGWYKMMKDISGEVPDCGPEPAKDKCGNGFRDYPDFMKFKNYYGKGDYADHWVTAALDKSATTYSTISIPQGDDADPITYAPNIDWTKSIKTEGSTAELAAGAPDSTYHDGMRKQAVKKGAAYMNTWMYVIREFEDAVDDCKKSCIACNDDPVHAWDEGVAFWTGSLEKETGFSSGKQIYALAEKRCKNFKTCGPNGDSTSLGSPQDTTAKVNFDLFYEFAVGEMLLSYGRCDEVPPVVRRVVSLMTVPLIQGTLRYSYKKYVPGWSADDEADDAGGFADIQAEGATFAAAVLPMVHACSPTDAKTIYDHAKIDAAYPADGGDYASWQKVKTAFENNYACLGVKCADIGGLWGNLALGTQTADGRRLSEKSEGYLEGAEPCSDSVTLSGGEYDEIAGYEPGSQVTDHAAIDQDQKAMESFMGETKTDDDFAKARKIYKEGGFSKSFAELTVPALPMVIKKGEPMYATSLTGGAVAGKAYEDYAKGATTIKFQYKTGDSQDTYSTCKAGGLLGTGLEHTDGCVDVNKTVLVTFGDKEVERTVLADVGATDVLHKNGRTLAGFSTGAKKKMREGCVGCPYEDFMKFYNYYGMDKYADHWVTAAFDKGVTAFKAPASNTDFSGTGQTSVFSNEVRTQSIKKGTAYMNVWMYVIREFEDAIDDCKSSCIACNDDPVHAWDEGVAFYTGSLAADTPNAAGGKLIWALAEKRCKNYQTCGPNGDSTSLSGTTAKVNNDLLFEFNKGRDALQAGKCAEVRPIVRKVVSLMTIPLIQGTIRYARYMGPVKNMGADKQSEAAVFAASVLPMVHACNPADAKIIDDHTKLVDGRKSGGDAQFTDVKEAFERNYACLGITCADVGGLVVAANEYYPDADPCVESPPPPPPPMPSMPPASLSEIAADLPTGALVGIIVAAVVAVFAVVCVLIMVCKERSGSPIFTPLDVKPSV